MSYMRSAITIRIDVELRQRLLERAASDGKSLSELVRGILENAIAKPTAWYGDPASTVIACSIPSSSVNETLAIFTIAGYQIRLVFATGFKMVRWRIAISGRRS